MVESNYDILKIQDGASKKDIRVAYRSLVLKLHSDRGGDDEQFKKSSVRMKIYELAKNILTPLLKKRRRQNSILVIPMLTSAEKIFYCLRIFHAK